jgi:ABC-type phosphate/phosphonate transport system substrate-binding protein
MKKILLTEIVILVGILIFGACAAASPSPVQPMAYKWPSLWKMGVTAIGGSSYALAAAWTPVMEQATGMKIRLVPERSTATTERWVKQGVVDTGFDTASVLGPDGMEATCGTGWDTREGGPYPMRVIWLSQMSWWGFMVRGTI